VRLVYRFDCNKVALFNQLQCCLPAPRRYEDRRILAFGKRLSQWLGSPAIWVARLPLNVKVSVEKESSIVDIIEDENPLPVITIVQPVVHELENVRLRMSPPIDLDCICNIPIALLKPGRIARVDPEYPRLWRLLSNSVGIFDDKLRLSTWELAAVIWIPVVYSPDTAEADERCPGPWQSTSLLDLIKQIASFNEVLVTAEGDGPRWAGWSFLSL
jgi:hypothetical protein